MSRRLRLKYVRLLAKHKYSEDIQNGLMVLVCVYALAITSVFIDYKSVFLQNTNTQKIFKTV